MIIGVIGPLDSCNDIYETLKYIAPNIEAKLYAREQCIGALEVIEECEKECDVIIFSGCGVCEAVTSNYKVKKPNVFVSRGGSSIIKAFWEARNNNISLDRFSIDVVENEILQDSLIDMNLTPTSVYQMPFDPSVSELAHIDWHIKLYEEKKIDLILTGFVSVYNELKKRGYPVFRLRPTIPQVRVSYEKLKTQLALNIAQHSQIAVQILSIVGGKASVENYYSNMLKTTEVYKFIVDYVKGIQGSIFSFGRAEYVVFAHKGAVDNETNFNNLFELEKNIKSLGFSLNVGIGIGTTAYEAEANAYKTLAKCADSTNFDIFLIDENNIIKGPLGSSNNINYSLIASDEKIINISNKTGLSCESILKLMALSETRKSNVYDAKELAECLSVSERSARRILNKIVSSNFGRVYAKETSQGGGRPKNLIELLF